MEEEEEGNAGETPEVESKMETRNVTRLSPSHRRFRRAARSQQHYRRGRVTISGLGDANSGGQGYQYYKNNRQNVHVIKSNVTDKRDCASICPGHKELDVPDCGETRVEPDFHEVCGCITRYHCCPHACPKVDHSKCKKGQCRLRNERNFSQIIVLHAESLSIIVTLYPRRQRGLKWPFLKLNRTM